MDMLQGSSIPLSLALTSPASLLVRSIATSNSLAISRLKVLISYDLIQGSYFQENVRAFSCSDITLFRARS
jgi:hypothetical protein